SWTDFAEQMWDTYRAGYGCVWTRDNQDDRYSNGHRINCETANHAPVLQSIGDKQANVNAALAFTITANDADGDNLSYSATNLPSGATFANRVFTWTPNSNQSGSYQVTFTVTDGQASDSEAVIITVGNINNPPVLADIGNKSVSENQLLSFTVSATDPDGNALTYSAQNLPAGAAFASRTFTWTPSYNQAETHQVTFTVSNGQASDSETITITISNVNRPPVLASIGSKTTNVNALLSFTVSATDPDGDTITYSAQNLPSGATFANRVFTWTPNSNQSGSYQVTFTVSDGALQDSETVTITVLAADTTAPKTSNLSPAADSIQVPPNTLIVLDITDTGEGVDAGSVSITLNGSVIYTGDTTSYNSSSGRCSRTGLPTDYSYIYQPNTAFDYDQTISVAANASDLADNVMSPYSYSFQTEMRSFSKNKLVNSDTANTTRARPRTVRDSSGNIYAVWHSGNAGERDIYLGKLPIGQNNFSSTIRITTNSFDQCNPAIAIDTANKLYLVWQDNRGGNWDIYGSTSSDGINWPTERKVSDSNNNEINPAIIIDKSSPPKAYVAWQDDRAGNQEIFISSSSDSFATNAVTRVTTNTADQTEPALTATAANVVYVLWTDLRNGSADIYAAASNSGPWSNVPVVTKSGNQTNPAIAAESTGSIVHLLWDDDSSGNRDIFYASSNGLTGTTLTGTNIIDDASSKDQIEPAIAVSGTGSTLKVFTCWQDKRNISGASGDTDLYFVQTNSGSGTNIFVGDDSANSNQNSPAIAVDTYGYPYIIWVDGRNSRTDIYYTASTFVSSTALASANITPSTGSTTIGTNPVAITNIDDVSIVIPDGAVVYDASISISKVNNSSNLSLEMLSSLYEFSPSGLYFDQPVSVTIPYVIPASGKHASAYWYNKLTRQLSKQGITDIQTLTISPTMGALQFKTTHFTQFVVVESAADGSSSGGSGGGCSYAVVQANPAEFFLPYAGLGVVMVAIKRHDVKKYHRHNRSQ
ncbi:MAG: putative Ig domain-containing protein, partial [Planctomycetota bacterium]